VNLALPVHRVRAVNTAPESENKIHDDRVAAQYGFRGGLVPGVTVYGYMTAPVIEAAPEWLERGTMQVRLLEPFYDGDEVIVKAQANHDGSIAVTAERNDGTLCAKGTAGLGSIAEAPPAAIPEAPLPQFDQRPAPSSESVMPGALLGTVRATLESADPAKVLQFSNDILVQNFRLGPWIHVSSELRNWSAGYSGDQVSAHGRVHERFDRKGHEFVVADVMLIGDGGRLLQTVRHTAIYKLRPPGAPAS
jgi:hypothetical protein